MLCPTCSAWAREASDTLDDHHPNCPERCRCACHHPDAHACYTSRYPAGLADLWDLDKTPRFLTPEDIHA